VQQPNNQNKLRFDTVSQTMTCKWLTCRQNLHDAFPKHLHLAGIDSHHAVFINQPAQLQFGKYRLFSSSHLKAEK